MAKLIEILAENNTLRDQLIDKEQIRIGIVGNCVLNTLEPYVENVFLNQQTTVISNFGSFDNLIENISLLNQVSKDGIFCIFFVDGLMDGLHTRWSNFNSDDVDILLDNRINELRSVLSLNSGLNNVTISAIFSGNSWNSSWTSFKRSIHYDFSERLRKLCNESPIFRYLDIQSALENAGLTKTFDLNRFNSKSTPLSPEGLSVVSKSIEFEMRQRRMDTKKVLVLDADDTLWGGVLGEDGIDGIALNPNAFPGNIFWQMQHAFLYFKSQGALLAMITKNDPKDIKDVFIRNANMVLAEDDFVSIRASWNDKAEVIAKLATDLNLSLKSFVFVDDSDLEISFMEAVNPDVTSIQVPHNVSNYPSILKDLNMHLVAGKKSKIENRTELYRIRASSQELERNSNTREDFLKSLSTKLIINFNTAVDAERISEMSQRTNQFNLTLSKFDSTMILKLLKTEGNLVVSGVVTDRFGSSGVSLGAVVEINNDVARFIGLWVSCRVLGREAELAFVLAILERLFNFGVHEAEFPFVQGDQNQQVEAFLVQITERLRSEGFLLNKSKFTKITHPHWIEIEVAT